MHAWDWAIVATYMVFAIGVGVAFTKRAGRSMTDYFLSGRRLPWWVAAA